jgi:aquaporin Z
MRKLLTEFIGTFFLVLTICLTVAQNVPMAPLAIGASLMIMVYMGGHVSGGHYNPAVTLALTLTGKHPAKELPSYWVVQVLGAITAALAGNLIVGSTIAPSPATGVGPLSAVLAELLYTFALALVVLNVATAKKTTGNSFYGLAIGFTIVVAAFAAGGISGGAFNPAVGTGPTLVHALIGGGNYNSLWIYWVGPLAGGALAALVFKVQED